MLHHWEHGGIWPNSGFLRGQPAANLVGECFLYLDIIYCNSRTTIIVTVSVEIYLHMLVFVVDYESFSHEIFQVIAVQVTSASLSTLLRQV
jgi:hypothetical protein